MITRKEILALNQTEYRLKVTFKSKSKSSYQYFVVNPYRGLRLVYLKELDMPEDGDISAMTKAEWKKLLPRVELICKQESKFSNASYKISFEEAFSYKDVLIVYFMPTKEPGTLTLAQLKKELKSSGIPIAAIEQDKKYHRYGSADKYYRLYILKQYKSKLNRYIKSASDYGNIGYEPPRY